MAVKMSNRCGQSAGKASNRDIFSEDIGWYLSGFADGEGSFNVTIMKRRDYKTGWKVCLSLFQRFFFFLRNFLFFLKKKRQN